MPFSAWGRQQRPLAASPVDLTLEDLIAMRPRNVRGHLAPGERFPDGARPGRRQSSGIDFDGVSPYVPGDDVRWIDWRTTARSGRLQMKRFVAESHRARTILVDLRPELYFGTRERLMAKTAALAVARLVWQAIALHEPVGLTVVPGGDGMVPRRGVRQALRLFHRLERDYAANRDGLGGALQEGAMAAALHAASGPLRRGDEVCVVSDFSVVEEAFATASRQLSPIRELRAFVVEDPLVWHAVPPGRYPVQEPGRPGPTTITVRRQAHDERARHHLRRRLRDLGWLVEPAVALVPTTARAAA